ncbi:MAG: AI-2E family transporter [bacterium]|nr:AI-2E family transporter [bacterium]
MSSAPDSTEKTLPPPWDRIFSLATRTFVWGLLIAVLWILSPFLLLIFLTFVFSYIQAHGVEGLSHRIKRRTVRVIVVGLVFVGTLVATGFTLAPQVSEEGQKFWARRDHYITQADRELDEFVYQWPEVHESLLQHREIKGALDKVSGHKNPGGASDSTGPERLPGTEPANPSPPATGPDKEGAANEPGKDAESGTKGEEAAEPESEREKLTLVADLFANLGEIITQSSLQIGQSVLGYASAFLLALLFSFLIVLDLPKIRRGVSGLGNTRVGFIYDEVADNIAGFGRVLGRALEAQLFIAIVNTILTAIGIWIMGLPNLLVLSTIVFFCSFIPVAGTFISSTPICLIALQQGGVTSMLLVVLLIMVIHAIETYVLNPQIYGHHMHMNPVVVLIVLTVGGKLFGVWGLLLGIPIVNYIWRHAIRFPDQRPKAP